MRSFDGLIQAVGDAIYNITTGVIDGARRLYEFRDAISLVGFALVGAFAAPRVLGAIQAVIQGIGLLLQAGLLAAKSLRTAGLFSFILTPVGATLTAIGAVLAAILVFKDEVQVALEDLGIDLDGITQRVREVVDPEGEGMLRAVVGDISEGILAIRERIFGPLPEHLAQGLKDSVEEAADAIELPEIVVTASPDSRTFIERMTDRMGEFVDQFGDLNQFAKDLLERLGLPSLGDIEIDTGQLAGVEEELTRLRADLQPFTPGIAGRDDDLSTGPGHARDRPNVFSLQVPQRELIFDDLGDQFLLSFRGGLRRALLSSGNVFESLGDLVLGTLADGLFNSATQQLAKSLQPLFDAIGQFISIGLQSLIGGVGGLTSGVTNAALAGSRSPVGFQDGGFIPGRLGEPRVVIAHGGELVLNPSQQEALLGGVTVQVTQQIYGDPSAEQRRALLRNADTLTDLVQARLQERRVLN